LIVFSVFLLIQYTFRHSLAALVPYIPPPSVAGYVVNKGASLVLLSEAPLLFTMRDNDRKAAFHGRAPQGVIC
jgi:hypothetical protein